MTKFNELTDALRNLITQRVQAKIEYTHGLLGDGLGRVKVPGRSDFVFVRPDRFSTRTAEIFNKRVTGPDGTPVIVGELPWEPGLTQVVDIDWETYKNAGPGWGNDFGGVGYHGQGHEWRDAAPGVDTFNVYRRQFGDLKTYPFSSGSTTVNVSSYSFNHLGSMKSWPGSSEFPLANAVPASTGTARFALVYWSPASGTSGYLGVATGTLSLDTETEILSRPLTPPGTIPSAYVRLAGGQTSITEFDIYDAREPWQPGIAFGTGNSLIHAGLIPISDTGGFYTGSTVEQALQEVADGGVAKVSKLWNLELVREIVTVDSPGIVSVATGSAVGISTVAPTTLLHVEDGVSTASIHDDPISLRSAGAGSFSEHFLQDDASLPAGWVAATAGNFAQTSVRHSNLYFQSDTTNTGYDYNFDSSLDLEADTTRISLDWVNVFWSDGQWSNDLDWFFGVYGDTGGGAIDTTMYVRVRLNWNSAGGSPSNWRIRMEVGDGAAGTAAGSWFDLDYPANRVLSFSIRLDASHFRQCFAIASYLDSNGFEDQRTMGTNLGTTAFPSAPTFGNMWFRHHLVRSAGGERGRLYLGGLRLDVVE